MFIILQSSRSISVQFIMLLEHVGLMNLIAILFYIISQERKSHHNDCIFLKKKSLEFILNWSSLMDY